MSWESRRKEEENWRVTNGGVDCGLAHTTDEEIKESLKKSVSGPEKAREVDGMIFGSIVE